MSLPDAEKLFGKRIKDESASEDRTLVLTGMIGNDDHVTVVLFDGTRMALESEPDGE